MGFRPKGQGSGGLPARGDGGQCVKLNLIPGSPFPAVMYIHRRWVPQHHWKFTKRLTAKINNKKRAPLVKSSDLVEQGLGQGTSGILVLIRSPHNIKIRFKVSISTFFLQRTICQRASCSIYNFSVKLHKL